MSSSVVISVEKYDDTHHLLTTEEGWKYIWYSGDAVPSENNNWHNYVNSGRDNVLSGRFGKICWNYLGQPLFIYESTIPFEGNSEVRCDIRSELCSNSHRKAIQAEDSNDIDFS